MTGEARVLIDDDGIVTIRRGGREVRGLRPYRGCQVACVLSAQETLDAEEERVARSIFAAFDEHIQPSPELEARLLARLRADT